jgi:hypothetical protein
MVLLAATEWEPVASDGVCGEIGKHRGADGESFHDSSCLENAGPSR